MKYILNSQFVNEFTLQDSKQVTDLVEIERLMLDEDTLMTVERDNISAIILDPETGSWAQIGENI